MDEKSKTWNERYPTMGTGTIRRDLSWAYLLSDVRPEEKGPMSAGDYQTIIAQGTAVNVLEEDGITYLVALIAPIEAENLTLLTGYRFNVLKEHLDTHIHDDGVCCECGGDHCCCDCPISTIPLESISETDPDERIPAALAEWDETVRRHSIGADADAEIDGGEWSGPAHDEALERALAQIAVKHGLSEEQLRIALTERFMDDDPEPMAYRPSQMEA